MLGVSAADDLEKIARGERLRTCVRAQVQYFNASAVKLRTLLRPDPEKDLERVLLLTNADR